MKERPILFKGEMVQAILAGTKTQTRRLVKLTDTDRVREIRSCRNWHLDDPNAAMACPYGQRGDRLWVRETYRFDGLDPNIGMKEKDPETVQYREDEDDEFVAWRPSIFMPRWASRITLEITGVRVERLNNISEADAMAEGVAQDNQPDPCNNMWCVKGTQVQGWNSAKSACAALWESINGPGSWAANPFVWVIEFTKRS